MSGLAGFPFTGKSGFSTFSSHCPKDGNIVILFAPRIGIDSIGTVGKIKRNGLDFATSSCGATI